VLQNKVNKMERVFESEQKETETEVEVEFEEEEDELEFIVPWEDEEMEDSSSGNRRLYGKTFGGFIAIVALLIVPLVTLPGMVVLVLFAEIYLVDWMYTKVNLIRKAKSTPRAGRAGRQDRMSKSDKKNSRSSPKDQFVK
jgi:hypothetical protein